MFWLGRRTKSRFCPPHRPLQHTVSFVSRAGLWPWSRCCKRSLVTLLELWIAKPGDPFVIPATNVGVGISSFATACWRSVRCSRS